MKRDVQAQRVKSLRSLGLGRLHSAKHLPRQEKGQEHWQSERSHKDKGSNTSCEVVPPGYKEGKAELYLSPPIPLTANSTLTRER
jgi:hypothetical protein